MTNWKQRLANLGTDCGGYVDPGTGSYLIQMLLAGVLGAGFAIKSFWANIRATFSGRKRDDNGSEA